MFIARRGQPGLSSRTPLGIATSGLADIKCERFLRRIGFAVPASCNDAGYRTDMPVARNNQGGYRAVRSCFMQVVPETGSITCGGCRSMSPLTVFLSRFYGLSCLLMCAVLVGKPKASLEAIKSMSPGLILVTGILTMIAGAAAVVGHTVFSGGALPVAVTLLGWVTLIKGVVLMAAPPRALNTFYRTMHYPARFRLYMAACLAFSAWLTVTAFTA
jgi:hypothetical protein